MDWKPGDKTYWLYTTTRGYGYQTLVPAVVVSRSAQRVRIRTALYLPREKRYETVFRTVRVDKLHARDDFVEAVDGAETVAS